MRNACFYRYESVNYYDYRSYADLLKTAVYHGNSKSMRIQIGNNNIQISDSDIFSYGMWI